MVELTLYLTSLTCPGADICHCTGFPQLLIINWLSSIAHPILASVFLLSMYGSHRKNLFTSKASASSRSAYGTHMERSTHTTSHAAVDARSRAGWPVKLVGCAVMRACLHPASVKISQGADLLESGITELHRRELSLVLSSSHNSFHSTTSSLYAWLLRASSTCGHAFRTVTLLCVFFNPLSHAFAFLSILHLRSGRLPAS